MKLQFHHDFRHRSVGLAGRRFSANAPISTIQHYRERRKVQSLDCMQRRSLAMKRMRSLFPLLLPSVLSFDVRRLPSVHSNHRVALMAEEAYGTSDHRDTMARTGLSSSGERDEDSDGCSVKQLSPVLQSIVDERREFQINLGRAMDTLRCDMQDILCKRPGKNLLRI